MLTAIYFITLTGTCNSTVTEKHYIHNVWVTISGQNYSWKKKSFSENSSLRVTKHEPDNPMTQSSKDINYIYWKRTQYFTRKKSHECVWKSLVVERHPVRTKQSHKNDLRRVTFKNRQHLTKNILGRWTVNNWRHLTSGLDAVPQLSSTAILSTTNLSNRDTQSRQRHDTTVSATR